MKKSRIRNRWFIATSWIFMGWLGLVPLPRSCAQHAHINAGALSREPHSTLSFLNGDAFVTNSGYLLNLTLTNQGQYAGHHQGSITFTALPATSANGGPAFGHANLGAKLELQILSVQGPPGGSFGFWEETDLAPRFTIPVGETNSPARFALSENDGNPGDDPYGHIHGRRFTATVPGLYTVGFRIIDSSQNGPNSGPLHAPSEVFSMFFQAGLTIHSIHRSASDTRIVFGGIPKLNVFVEASDSLPHSSAPAWTTLAGPIPTTNRTAEVLLPTPAQPTSRPAQFFRLRAQRVP